MPISQWLKEATLQNHLRSRCESVDTMYSGLHIHISFQSNKASVSFMNKFHSTKNSHSIEKLLAAFSDKLNDSTIVIISHFHTNAVLLAKDKQEKEVFCLYKKRNILPSRVDIHKTEVWCICTRASLPQLIYHENCFYEYTS